ncbi:MAG: hypothetical protein E5W76_10790, partial [Mesorhizobium sp.]
MSKPSSADGACLDERTAQF